MSEKRFVKIQSHSMSNSGTFVRFDYRFERAKALVLEVIDEAPIMVLEIVDDPNPKKKGEKITRERAAVPTDDVFFSPAARQQRVAWFNAGKIPQYLIELLSDEAEKTGMFSIRAAVESDRIIAEVDANDLPGMLAAQANEMNDLKRQLAELQGMLLQGQLGGKRSDAAANPTELT